MEEKCKEGGKQEVNLEKNQIFGRMKLGKRVRKGEVYISPSDKGKGVVVMPLNMYAQMVETHTKKDQEVKWEELEKAQKEIRSHSRSLGKILGIGENEGERNVSRCYNNLSEKLIHLNKRVFVKLAVISLMLMTISDSFIHNRKWNTKILSS